MDENKVGLEAITRAIKTGNQYLIDAINDILKGKVEGDGVMVKRADLVFMSRLECQHFTTVGSTCFEHGRHGDCCNACWVRRWAKKQLSPVAEKQEENPNENCLEGFRCPKCGSYEPFKIAANSWFEVHDSGTDSFADVEWDHDSSCICMSCNYTGTVADFEE